MNLHMISNELWAGNNIIVDEENDLSLCGLYAIIPRCRWPGVLLWHES